MRKEDDSKYLVLTGNEYGFDLGDMIDLSFKNFKEANELYDQFVAEYDCAAMFRVDEDGLVHMKSRYMGADEDFVPPVDGEGPDFVPDPLKDYDPSDLRDSVEVALGKRLSPPNCIGPDSWPNIMSYERDLNDEVRSQCRKNGNVVSTRVYAFKDVQGLYVGVAIMDTGQLFYCFTLRARMGWSQPFSEMFLFRNALETDRLDISREAEELLPKNSSDFKKLFGGGDETF